MLSRFATGAAVVAAALAWGVPKAQAQYVPGNFTYQFANPATGAPETTATIPTVGGTVQVAVYLIQTGQTTGPTDLFNLPSATPPGLGVQGLGVRLNYTGGAAQVPNTFLSSIKPRPPTATEAANIGATSDFDFVNAYGSGTTTGTGVTASSAALSEGLLHPNDPLPFPGDSGEDPLNNPLRILIGTFTFQALASGTETVTAVSGPVGGAVNSLSGPNPPVLSTAGGRADGTTGYEPGSTGNINIDQFLNPVAPVLTITVPVVPEPGTLALSGLAALGLAAWRRRRTAAPVAA